MKSEVLVKMKKREGSINNYKARTSVSRPYTKRRKIPSAPRKVMGKSSVGRRLHMWLINFQER